MCTTSNSCLCFNLRTWTLIIGWLSVLGYVSIVSMVYIFDQRLMVRGIFHLLMAIALLYGVYKPYKPAVFWYWLLETLTILQQITSTIFFLIDVGADGDVFVLLRPYLSILCLYLVIKMNCIGVVLSYYKEIERVQGATLYCNVQSTNSPI